MLQLGTTFASAYRVEALLGEGGYGAVFAATELALGRKVALKVLHPEVLARRAAVGRFQREAALAQGLSHPNTVRLFTFGQVGETPYIVYEFLDGQSLDRAVAQAGRFDAARTARVASQTLKALMEAHQKGIVHRDIKPQNIFLCHFSGEPDFVKVLDFGIASAAASGDTPALTQEGGTVGTPAYMAKEQVLAGPLDGRADLYSLGLVMAEALSGRPVFAGRAGMQVAMLQVADAPVPLPPEATDSVLGEVIKKATEKDLNRRFGSAGEMLAAITQATSNVARIFSGTGNATALPMRMADEPTADARQALRPTGVPSSGSVSSAAVSSAATGSAQRFAYGTDTFRDPRSVQPTGPTAMVAAAAYAPTGLVAPAAYASPATGQAQAWNAHGGGTPITAPSTLSAQYQPLPITHPKTLQSAAVTGEGSRSRTPIFVLGGVAAIVALAAGIGGTYFFLGRSSAKSNGKGQSSAVSESSGNRTGKKGGPTVDQADPVRHPMVQENWQSFKVHGVPIQTMLARMTKAGWQFDGSSEGDFGLGKQVTYNFDDPHDNVANLRFLKLNPKALKTADGFGLEGVPSLGLSVNDNGSTVELMIIGDDTLTQPTMDKILAKPD